MSQLINRTEVLKQVALCKKIYIEIQLSEYQVYYIRVSKREAVQAVRTTDRDERVWFLMAQDVYGEYYGLLGEQR